MVHTFSSDGISLVETVCGAPPGTLTQLKKPASSTESLSISPSTFNSTKALNNNWGKQGRTEKVQERFEYMLEKLEKR